MSKKFLHSQFNKRVHFGIIKPVLNEASGDYEESFVETFEVWAMIQHRSLSLEYKISGTTLDGTILVVVRHNDKLTDQLKAKLNGVMYNISNISPDNSNYMSYDYITLKQYEEV